MALAPGLARKLKKLLDTRTDSPDVLASLGTLSEFYGDNTVQARRNLQATIERRAVSTNHEFLQASRPAQKALDAVESEVRALALSCDRIAESLSSCSAITVDIVAATEKMKLDLDNTKQRQQIVSSFLHGYQLSPEEVQALREEDLNQSFFQALARVQEIHANCKLLLRTHHQRAGLELMDLMAVYQEGAYERLCRWVQTEWRTLSENDQPEVGNLLRTASRCLKERPALFRYCAEELANTRHNALFKRFISALTRGGPGGMPRPIEVHAHDPLRYVGDMLAWLHQALASERELVLSLDMQPGQEPQSDFAFVLDRIFEGVCRPFKARVDQVLNSPLLLQASYKLSNLLGFYSDMIGDLLGQTAALSTALKDVKDASERTFFDILKARGLPRYPTPVSTDLSPPPALFEGVSVLSELMETYNSMMVAAGRAKPDFEPVIAALIDPILEMCEQAAGMFGSKTEVTQHARRLSVDSGRRLSSASFQDMALSHSACQDVTSLRKMFLVNCLCAIQQPLQSYAAASGYVKTLEARIREHMDAIVEQEAAAILDKCRLQRKIAYLKERASEGEQGKRLSEVEEMSPSSVSESLKMFLKFVSDGVVAELGQALQDTRLRSEACSGVARQLAGAYEGMYGAIVDPSSGYAEPRLLLRHTPQQMRTMLSI